MLTRAKLERRARDRPAPARVAERARIGAAVGRGADRAQIAERVGCSEPTWSSGAASTPSAGWRVWRTRPVRAPRRC